MLGTWETWARSNKTSANTLASLLNEIEQSVEGSQQRSDIVKHAF